MNEDFLIEVIENTRKQAMAKSARDALRALVDYGRSSLAEQTLTELEKYEVLLQRIEFSHGERLMEAMEAMEEVKD